MLKQTLLAFTVLGFVGSAAAADITNPFYLAQKGQVGSVTSASLERIVYKNVDDYTKANMGVVTEELQYGITNTLALIGSVGNTWDHWKGNWVKDDPSTKTHHDDENISFSAGLAWNVLTGPAKMQVSAQYGQDRLKDFDGAYKYVAAETKLGYQFKRVLPYISGGVEVPVAQKSWGDKLTYNAKAGIYQGKCEVWALDTGVRLVYDENIEARAFVAEAEASYYMTKNSTIGVFGTYALKGKAEHKTDIYDKSVGARLRVFF